MSAEILVKKNNFSDGLAAESAAIPGSTGTELLAAEFPELRNKQLGLADLWKIQQSKRSVSVYPRRV